MDWNPQSTRATAGRWGRTPLLVVAAMSVVTSGCTMSPDYKSAVVTSQGQKVPFWGFMMGPNVPVKVQLLHNPSGLWVDVASTTSATTPQPGDSLWGGTPQVYRWGLDIDSPVWSPAWFTPTCEVPVSANCGSYATYRVLMDNNNGQGFVPSYHMDDPNVTGPGWNPTGHALGCFTLKVVEGVDFLTAGFLCVSPEPFQVRIFSTYTL